MARVRVEIMLTVPVVVEVELPGTSAVVDSGLWEEERELAYAAMPDAMKELEHLDVGSEDMKVTEILRASDVEVPKVQAPKHDDMWED
jgi:hypothetical protein